MFFVFFGKLLLQHEANKDTQTSQRHEADKDKQTAWGHVWQKHKLADHKLTINGM